MLLLATGSEVALCVAAHEQLAADGVRSRVVSMPSWELFDRQPQEYQDSVLLPAVTARVCVEQGYARLEWSVLDWNRPAIAVYRGLGAAAMDEWTVFRLGGEALRRLGS